MNKTIVIADDNSALCESIRQYLNSQDGFEVVGIAPNGVKAIELVTKQSTRFASSRHRYAPELDGFGVLASLEGKNRPS